MLKFIGIGVFLLSICIIHLLNRVRDLSNRLDEVDDYITDRIKEEREARYAAYDRANPKCGIKCVDTLLLMLIEKTNI